MLVLRAALMEYAHASLVMKGLTVAAARMDIARQPTRHVKVWHYYYGNDVLPNLPLCTLKYYYLSRKIISGADFIILPSTASDS